MKRLGIQIALVLLFLILAVTVFGTALASRLPDGAKRTGENETA